MTNTQRSSAQSRSSWFSGTLDTISPATNPIDGKEHRILSGLFSSTAAAKNNLQNPIVPQSHYMHLDDNINPGLTMSQLQSVQLQMLWLLQQHQQQQEQNQVFGANRPENAEMDLFGLRPDEHASLKGKPKLSKYSSDSTQASILPNVDDEMLTAARILCDMSSKNSEYIPGFGDRQLHILRNEHKSHSSCQEEPENGRQTDIEEGKIESPASDNESSSGLAMEYDEYADNEDGDSVGIKSDELRHQIHGREYRARAQQLLKSKGSVVDVRDRKAALGALLDVLNCGITVTISGKKNPRQFLYDTLRKRRYRTYGDAIRCGALDELILKTGSSVLLKSCHREAEKRFDALTH